MFWIGGKHTVIEVIKNSKRIIYEIVVLDEDKKKIVQAYGLHNKIKINNIKFFKNIFTEDVAHQGFAAKIDALTNNNITQELKNNSLENNIVVLDEITDPRNVGSIIRTCAAFNIKSLIIKKRSFNNKSASMYKAASGCVEKVKIYEVSNLSTILKQLKENNYFVTGLDSNSKNYIDNNTKFFLKNIFIFGSEEYGIRHLTKEHCDQLLKIKIGEVESLNVSNSVSSFLALFRLIH
jgi:23S rRNA (guanosine2251-2'-O)-methyltransferase